MMRAHHLACLALAATLGASLPAAAAGQAPARPGPRAAPTPEVRLVFEREIFAYAADARRDPFQPLTGSSGMGPRFEELRLLGIVFSPERGRSIAVLSDADSRVHRVRVGQRVGNARVIEIGPIRVVLAVENFGNVRQEMLELKKREGTDR